MKSEENSTPKRKNKLLGWLVSYQYNSRGSYYEIREGRSFFGNGVVQNERVIVLDGKQFTTAHASLKASPSEGVMIQDMFSSSGTYVSKAGSNDEQLVSTPTELGHGDWVRFGDSVKFQLCLIDGGF